MMEEFPKYIPLEGTVGDSFFARQRDDYSCGPASLATVAKIFGVKSASYDFCRAAAKPDPETGTPCEHMHALSKKFLPCVSEGRDTYEGGVAIANIVMDEDHYVVFLCREDDKLMYYDPFFHELVIDKMENVDWASLTEDRLRWSINFAPLEDNGFDKWLAKTAPAKTPGKKHAKGAFRPSRNRD
ncbi:MAG: hypothetical protein GC185_06920 [Alphaproteobacteria bacterium]|nr:hypothetical protein [Alphaproteobacteria bacterium]